MFLRRRQVSTSKTPRFSEDDKFRPRRQVFCALRREQMLITAQEQKVTADGRGRTPMIGERMTLFDLRESAFIGGSFPALFKILVFLRR